ncbi:MAG: SURF1 family protein [Gammaproteobacteria bacterium]|nr:MAG: SURF1 family protein [Gammaproteobacteria bacterium]RLA54355.1 MAG: SURF1 family protein [Gammaproteobacteria bacterium]HDY82351.1 SURF1 family protein [Halieaceae bacterium]
MPHSGVGFQFDPEWRITLFTVVMVTLMVGLGLWQLQRAEEKAALAEAFAQRQVQHPALLSELWDKPASTLAYAPVQLTGTFLQGEYFLLDNRISGGRFGYEVLGILRLGDGSGTVLVNRGWIAGDSSRRELPDVPQVRGQVNVTGHVYVAPGAPYLLAEQQLQAGWPKRIQAVEMDKLQPPIMALVSGAVFPYPVRIDADAPGALLVDWQVVNMSPHKHQGYALQWFVMAAVLFVFYVLRCSNLWQLLSASRGWKK